MTSKKSLSPGQIALLAVATVAALGFAYWNINRALGPPAPAQTTAAPKPAVPPVATAGAPEATSAAPEVRAAPGPIASGTSSEVVLAPNANPFSQLPPITPGPAGPVAGPRTVYVPPPAPTTHNPLPPVAGGNPPVMPIPPMNPGVRPIPPAPLPELVGTLIGGQPSAVFRADKSLAIVPVGGRFAGWSVVSVSHGGVVVRSGRRRVHLVVGETRSAEKDVSRADTPSRVAVAPSVELASPEPPQVETPVSMAESGRSMSGIRAYDPAQDGPLPDAPQIAGSDTTAPEAPLSVPSWTGGGVRLAQDTGETGIRHTAPRRHAAPSRPAIPPARPAAQTPPPMRTNAPAAVARQAVSERVSRPRRVRRHSLRRRGHRTRLASRLSRARVHYHRRWCKRHHRYHVVRHVRYYRQAIARR